MFLNQYKQNKSDSINNSNNGDNSKNNKNGDRNTIIVLTTINRLFQTGDFSTGSTADY